MTSCREKAALRFSRSTILHLNSSSSFFQADQACFCSIKGQLLTAKTTVVQNTTGAQKLQCSLKP